MLFGRTGFSESIRASSGSSLSSFGHLLPCGFVFESFVPTHSDSMTMEEGPSLLYLEQPWGVVQW